MHIWLHRQHQACKQAAEHLGSKQGVAEALGYCFRNLTEQY